MHIQDLETPSVLIDLDIMEKNIQTMQAKCDAIGLNFRAHIKTHKLPLIAQMQLDAGAIGIACQKTSEAMVFAEAGFTDIQLPYNILGEAKTNRLAQMAKMGVRLTVSADHPAVIEGLQAAAKRNGVRFNVLADIATHIKRTGTDVTGVLQLARMIHACEDLDFAGILVYPSDVSARPAVQEALAGLQAEGIPVNMVSGGGSGASLQMGDFPELTEIRVGTYVFYDWKSVSLGWATLDQCAMHVAATVVSTPSPDRVILDTGRKSLSSDSTGGEYGHLVEYPNARIYNLSEEHTHVDVSQCVNKPQIGERVHVIPVHTCVVTNLHNQIYAVRGETVEATWDIAARGLVW
jgi:D-serine deaminase-like pyridoxal phosphate-dependent protein